MTEIILHRSCCLSSQRYNFLKANHNNDASIRAIAALFIKSKIQFFESKSQLNQLTSILQIGCLSSQRYNFLKANHNLINSTQFLKMVVYQVKDTIFWKQITTLDIKFRKCSTLFIKSKIQFFESKSQQTYLCPQSKVRCLSSQRYNFLKANHNFKRIGSLLIFVVYQVKDTIFWKQITTKVYFSKITFPLFIKSKIQFFESKSQQSTRKESEHLRCLSSQRYNFLKANHNTAADRDILLEVVY